MIRTLSVKKILAATIILSLFLANSVFLPISGETAAPTGNKQSFEGYAAGTDIGLTVSAAAYGTVTVSDAYARSGSRSAYFWSNNNAGGTRAQALVTDGSGAYIVVEAGKNYRVTFWVFSPDPDDSRRQLNFWLTATDGAMPTSGYTSGAQKDAAKVYDMYTHQQQLRKSVWTRISADIDNCKYSGYLRLGVTSKANSGGMFYIDDIEVHEYQSFSGAQTFEDYVNYDDIGLSAAGGVVVASNERNYTAGGGMSAKVISNTLEDETRPQFLVTNGADQEVIVQKEKSYLVTFRALVNSEEQTLRYWLAATEDTLNGTVIKKPLSGFASNNKKNIVYEQENIPLTAGQWALVTAKIENCAYSGYLRLGVTTAKQNGGSWTVGDGVAFLDDIHVIEINRGLAANVINSAVSENVQIGYYDLFVNKGNVQLTDGSNTMAPNSAVYKNASNQERSAFRFVAQYAYVGTKEYVQVDNYAVQVLRRGILLGNGNAAAEELKAKESGKFLAYSEVDAMADSWGDSGSTLEYTFKLYNIGYAKKDTEYSAIPYLVLDTANGELIVYGDKKTTSVQAVYNAIPSEAGVYGWYSEP